MSPLACPKCRQLVSDDALDAGVCPYCGYDGAMVFTCSPKGAWLVATALVVLMGASVGAYLLYPHSGSPRPVAGMPPAGQAIPQASSIAPEPPDVAPPPRAVEMAGSIVPAPVPPVMRDPPKPRPERRGPVVRIDVRETRERHIDNPDGTVLVTDMNRDDRLTLTGRVGLLKIGTVAGKATLDASGLQAEEIHITGDISESVEVKLNAPNGAVTVGGHVVGNARLIINAPGGEVIVAGNSGRLDGGAEVTVTAKFVDVKCPMSGRARLVVTMTGGGTATLGPVHDRAAVVYKPADRP
jgi:hypothetical protein